jgi:hypothetical protein
MADAEKGLPLSYSMTESIPTAGYQVMEPLVENAIQIALDTK